MKRIAALALIVTILFACKKENINPSNLVAGTFLKDSTYVIEREELNPGTDSADGENGNCIIDSCHSTFDKGVVFRDSIFSIANTYAAFAPPHTGVVSRGYSVNNNTITLAGTIRYATVQESQFNISTTDSFHILTSVDNRYKIFLRKR